MLKFARSWSIIGRNGIDWPNEMQCPSSHVTGAPDSTSARRSS